MENFVTYEVGKKLKEKGYSHDYNAFGYRCIYSEECTIKFISDIGAYERGYYGEHIPCPSISQVLKWLREDKKISIQPLTIRGGTWEAQITFTDDNDVNLKNMFGDKSLWTDDRFTSYEQAALAGIEYVLDNLI